jgi:four helix bundle protein
MTLQIRRAAKSVPANIAEGNGREITGAWIASLRIAQGSLKELEALPIESQDVELIEPEEAENLPAMCKAIGKPLRALICSLQQKVEN